MKNARVNAPGCKQLTLTVNSCYHTPFSISVILGLCEQHMFYTQVKGQMKVIHSLNVKSIDDCCDTALFMAIYDVTMAKP